VPAGRGHAFGQIAITPPPPPPVPPPASRLAIGEPDDEFEREADRVAERVMRGSGPPDAGAGGAPVSLRARRGGGSPGGHTVAAAGVHAVLASPGRPLDAATRASLEPRFGHDFSRVRIHADASAAASAGALRALAYTVGRDVVFGTGQYAPETAAGRELLAHELAHVVQQGSASAPWIQRRAAPGTHGHLPEHGCYAVYATEVKVGGAPCWRFNNPGNVGPFAYPPRPPAGVLARIPKGPPCGAGSIDLLMFDTPASGAAETDARMDDDARKQKFVCSSLLDYSHMGQPYLDAITKRCTFLQGQMPTAQKCQDPAEKNKGINMANLTSVQLRCIKDAIVAEECGFAAGEFSANKGTTYTCTPSTPAVFRDMLGCT
jgi:hypothetical protein